MHINGFEEIHLEFETSKVSVWNAMDCLDDNKVVLKTLRMNHESQDQQALTTEYDLLREIDSPFVLKPKRIARINNQNVLILEHPSSSNIELNATLGLFDTENFLKIARNLTNGLAAIHEKKIIHKNINSQNVYCDMNTCNVKIAGFELATKQHFETQNKNTPTLTGLNLEYISPELTGRMNRAIDYRSDYYSLGILFYEMLLGIPPFRNEEQIKLIHAHLASPPPNASKKGRNIPKCISDIIHKLMEKNPEDRYQSPQGILDDLDTCNSIVRNQKWRVRFTAGSNDFTGSLQIPQKLYGRAQQLSILKNCFENVLLGKKQLVVITGQPGVGKTALVNELSRPVAEKQGLFVCGKFEQNQQNIPYSAIKQAFSELSKWLMMLPDDELETVRKELNLALGRIGQVLINVIPDFSVIIGHQQPISDLEGTESQNRVFYALQESLKVISSIQRPLVMFLDDVHCADPSSLSLINKLLLAGPEQGFLLILAIRNHSEDPLNPLNVLLNDIGNREDHNITNIEIENLEKEHVAELLADYLFTNNKHRSEIDELTKLVYDKSNGTPLFTRQFIENLNKENLLIFNYDTKQWEWNAEKIKEQLVTDNVVDLLSEKITNLPADLKCMLKLAACIGNEFEINILTIISSQFIRITPPLLLEAIEQGFIYISTSNKYRFTHDRIQQIFYDLIDPTERPGLHLSIGRSLNENTPQNTRNESLFDIVNHFDKGQSGVTDQQERLKLAELYFLAYKKAKQTAAYQSAHQYCSNAMAMLSFQDINKVSDLCANIYLGAAESSFMIGIFDQMEQFTDHIINKSPKLEHKLRAYEIRIQTYTARNLSDKAVATTLEGLRLLGIRFPKTPNWGHTFWSFVHTLLIVRFRPPEALASLPNMKDTNHLAAVRLLVRVSFAAYTAAPKLFPLIVLKRLRLVLSHGLSAEGTYAFTGFGLLLCSSLKKYDLGGRYAETGKKILQRFPVNEYHSKVLFINHNFINHWQQNLRDSLKSVPDTLKLAIENGDLETASCGAAVECFHRLIAGYRLYEIVEHMNERRNLIATSKQGIPLRWWFIYRQFIDNLQSKTPKNKAFELVGDFFNENTHENTPEAEAVLFSANLCRLQLAYIWGNKDARRFSLEGEKYYDSMRGFIAQPLFRYYQSLALIAGEKFLLQNELSQIKVILTRNRKTMKKWAQIQPANFAHKYNLIEAEYAWHKKKQHKAAEYFTLAIKQAKEHHFLPEEALSRERFALYYHKLNNMEMYSYQMQESYKCYQNWGATAKLYQMEHDHADALQSLTGFKTYGPSAKETGILLDQHDIEGIFQIANTLSVKLDYKALMEKMMGILLEAAGAERAALIRIKDESMYLSAYAKSRSTIQTYQNELLHKSENLPMQLINYTLRKHEVSFFDNISSHRSYANDPYVRNNNIKSVLCLPIFLKENISGIVYLENNLAVGVFTEKRKQQLRLLSGQIAISVENAHLYENLRQEVELATSKYKTANLKLSEALKAQQEAQAQLIQKEKMAALGMLIAGIGHEINTPLGAIRSSIQSIDSILDRSLKQLPVFAQKLSPLILEQFVDILSQKSITELGLKMSEKRKWRKELQLQLEEMGVAKARTFADLFSNIDIDGSVKRYADLLLSEHSEEIIENLSNLVNIKRSNVNITTAIERAARIVFALKSYSHQDQEGEMSKYDIRKGIEAVLVLYHHKIKHHVELSLDLGEIPSIWCHPDQLNQVWTNIVHNALQAMDPKGSLHIATYTEEGSVVAKFADSGHGIPEELKTRIFEPFFTTKDRGEGSGLGLGIVKGIVKKHNGVIKLESQVGQGTTFYVHLPISIAPPPEQSTST